MVYIFIFIKVIFIYINNFVYKLLFLNVYFEYNFDIYKKYGV